MTWPASPQVSSTRSTSATWPAGVIYTLNLLLGFQLGIVLVHNFKKKTVTDGWMVARFYVQVGARLPAAGGARFYVLCAALLLHAMQALCCGVVYCIALCCAMLGCGVLRCAVLWCIALCCCAVLWCGALLCGVVWCIALCCWVCIWTLLLPA